MNTDITSKLSQINRDIYSKDQLNEIEEGIAKGLDISIYADPKFQAIQMHEIRKGLESGVSVKLYADPLYNWFQMEEIRLGLEAGLDASVYARRSYSFQTMRQIRKGLEEGMDLEKFAKLDPGILKELRHAGRDHINIVEYIKQGYNPEQLEEIRHALKNKCNIAPYLNIWYRGEAIRQIALGLEKGINVSLYANTEYDWHQMEEIRLGLEHRIDAARYAKKLAGWRQMHEIRLGLEEGLDVSSYESLMFSGRDMQRRRLRLLEDKDKVFAGSEDDKNPYEASGSLQDEFNKKAADFSTAEVKIFDNELKAYLVIEDTAFAPSTKETLAFLNSKGVVNGYRWDRLSALQQGTNTEKTICVAEGKPASRGADGYYEYMLEGKAQYQPVYNEDGSIDFGRSTWYKTVEMGETLVKYHPSQPGTSGMTVTGKTISAERGRDLEALSGTGFVLADDSLTYIAGVSGVIEYYEATCKLSVVPFLEIDNLNSLNSQIMFDGTLHIKGTVEANSFVQVTGDCMIDGYVDNACIKAGGNIILKKGMNGGGTGVLEAGGNIDGLFFENCNMQAGGSILANYCLNCSMTAEEEIQVLGKRGYIGGGNVSAGKVIRAGNIGNKMNIKTFVSVGLRDSAKDQEMKLISQKDEINGQLKILKNALTEYQIRYSAEERNAMPVFIQIEDAIYTKNRELDQVLNKLESIDKDRELAKYSRVIVDGTVYEGTVISINGSCYRPSTLWRVTFRASDGKVAFSSTK